MSTIPELNPRYKLLTNRRNELIKKKQEILSKHKIGTVKYFEAGKEISKINIELKQVNIEWSSYHQYERFSALWECAKAYIPVEERESFYKKVDKYLEEKYRD